MANNMSYEAMPSNPSADRVLRLIEEADDRDSIWVRTLNLNKGGVTVIGKNERIKALALACHAERRKTLNVFYRIMRHTMQGTSSIDGWIMSQLTETKVHHRTDVLEQPKPNLFGGKK